MRKQGPLSRASGEWRSPAHSRFDLSAWRLTAVALHRGGDELARVTPARPAADISGATPLATNANAFGRKIDMNARRPIDAARSRMRGADLVANCVFLLSTVCTQESGLRYRSIS